MVCNEEKLLVNVLYRSESEALKDVDLININFEKLIKIASSHLMLPAFFFNIQKKKLNHLFPDDFIEYLQNIYSINKARNEVLLNEVQELSTLLHKNKINHIFLKGSALLIADVFEDIGVRMIGDIDFMIQKNDEALILKILKDNNYISFPKDFMLFKHKHLPRHTHENKMFAIEPHVDFLAKGNRHILNYKELNNSFKDVNKKIKIPPFSVMFKHCIYSFQLEDFGFVSSSYSHRSIYDIYKLNIKYESLAKSIKFNVYIKHFFITINKFKIFKLKLHTSLLAFYLEIIFKYSLKFYLKIYQTSNKILRLILSSKYRKHLLNKFLNIQSESLKF